MKWGCWLLVPQTAQQHEYTASNGDDAECPQAQQQASHQTNGYQHAAYPKECRVFNTNTFFTMKQLLPHGFAQGFSESFFVDSHCGCGHGSSGYNRQPVAGTAGSIGHK